MKASEICIGDWFKAIDYNSPFRITAIYDDVVQTQADYQSEIDGNWYSEAEIKDLVPINLTESILVKNGFEKQGDLYQYHINAGDGYTRIDIIDLQDGVWSYDIDVYDKFAYAHKIHHDDDCFLKLHQLQHLLRLCGVEKEIEL